MEMLFEHVIIKNFTKRSIKNVYTFNEVNYNIHRHVELFSFIFS